MCITLVEKVNLDDLDLFGGFCIASRQGTSHKYLKSVLAVKYTGKVVKQNRPTTAVKKQMKPVLGYINNLVKANSSSLKYCLHCICVGDFLNMETPCQDLYGGFFPLIPCTDWGRYCLMVSLAN